MLLLRLVSLTARRQQSYYLNSPQDSVSGTTFFVEDQRDRSLGVEGLSEAALVMLSKFVGLLMLF